MTAGLTAALVVIGVLCFLVGYLGGSVNRRSEAETRLMEAAPIFEKLSLVPGDIVVVRYNGLRTDVELAKAVKLWEEKLKEKGMEQHVLAMDASVSLGKLSRNL